VVSVTLCVTPHILYTLYKQVSGTYIYSTPYASRSPGPSPAEGERIQPYIIVAMPSQP
jgi:hypothetical protein